MGKISKALEKSNSEKSGKYPETKVDEPEEEQIHEPYSTQELSPGEPANEIDFQNLDHSLVTIHSTHSVESEQFRLLKNNILFPETGTPPRSIMITSPSPNEGKSFIAANLAITIARSIDEYVLLMDCDLRSPTIHTLFGMNEAEEGLSEYLLNAKPLSALFKKTIVNKLTVLPGGQVPHNPSELLSSEQMRRLIHEVKLRYSDRYIIIDTPPPYMTSEGNALARQMDGIILVIRHGKTRMKDIEDIISIYGKEKILGVVQNFAKKSPGYGYGYYKYGYGKK